MKKIRLSKDAEKFLLKVPAKHRKQLAYKLHELMHGVDPHDAQQLKGYTFKRIDVGEYRIIFRFLDDMAEVPLIGKRNDDEIYKKLKRKLI